MGKFLKIKIPIFKLFVCLVGISLISPGDASRFEMSKTKTVVAESSQAPTTIEQIAAQITVKVLATEALGSGIIWENQNSSYIVITNQHVLRAGESPYYIQTPDGQIHHARVLSNFTKFNVANPGSSKIVESWSKKVMTLVSNSNIFTAFCFKTWILPNMSRT